MGFIINDAFNSDILFLPEANLLKVKYAYSNTLRFLLELMPLTALNNVRFLIYIKFFVAYIFCLYYLSKIFAFAMNFC